MQGSTLELPAGYYLEHDPDILILRRLDGSMVGAFSTRGAVPEAVLGAIEETYPQSAEDASRKSPMPALSVLQARFFGHFEMFCNGEVVPLGRNGKALAILKYLLAHYTRPVSQDYLMGWLWPESSLKKARWSLNSAIHVLRKLLLSRCPSSSATVNYIVLEEGYYRLCPTVEVKTDVDEFEARYEKGRHLEKEGRTEEAVAEYEKAIELYRDEYLVEDLYEDWTMVERERLSNAYVDMLDRLAAHYHETGRHQESIQACLRLLEKDPCYENSHRLVMKCYACLGLLIRASHHYQSYKHILQRRLGQDPSPEFQSLYRQILGK
jgi:DNA-binding SARP family transcriptional activator